MSGGPVGCRPNPLHLASGGPSTPADPAVAGGRQPHGGAKGAALGYPKKKGKRPQESGGARRAPSDEGRLSKSAQMAPLEGCFREIVKKKREKMIFIMRMQNNRQSHGAQREMQILEKSAHVGKKHFREICEDERLTNLGSSGNRAPLV